MFRICGSTLNRLDLVSRNCAPNLEGQRLPIKPSSPDSTALAELGRSVGVRLSVCSSRSATAPGTFYL